MCAPPIRVTNCSCAQNTKVAYRGLCGVCPRVPRTYIKRNKTPDTLRKIKCFYVRIKSAGICKHLNFQFDWLLFD